MANLKEFNSSLETTRQWISELMETLGTDEVKSCRVLRITLHELRDHLTIEEAAHFAAQLPLLLRGLFYEGWRPLGKLFKSRSRQKFLANIASSLKETEDIEEVEKMVKYVFMFLDRKVSDGEIRDVVKSLPKGIQKLWPVYVEQQSA